MGERIKCITCDNQILEVTAKHNDGLCGQCKMRAKAADSPPLDQVFTGKYDDAKWHYGGDFPSELPDSSGATHIGMFVASCVLAGMAGSLHLRELSKYLDLLRNREITPGAWLIEACDEKFTEEDLDSEGNAFALEYYFAEDAKYIADYDKTLCKKLPSSYHVPDTWDSFKKIDKVIQKRLKKWRKRS